jgi:AraC family transcriptional activator of tynA and feaB
MKRVFSTLNVHPRDRFDFWHSIACATIVGYDSIPAQRNLFSADIDVGALAEIGVVRFENAPMRVARTAAHVAQAWIKVKNSKHPAMTLVMKSDKLKRHR